ncbi:hypothetical protein [Phocaeicola paurosaccharolyticus]|uniref:hypothetical protein n=1 Tax=Phocaeicola paurosaccharolyticus TaxID=732242 RepID=UPI000468B420|nr:hypothetical protein [Phocaeicola paurosaccharolyticus]
MNSAAFEIDTKSVLNLFADLDRKKQVKVYRDALKRGSSILVRAARKELKNRIGNKVNDKNRWNGKSLQSGIRYSVNKGATEAKVNILGDFRLKFFEMGTKPRQLRKAPRKGANRGQIESSKFHFFDNAKAATEKEIFDNMNSLISESIIRISNKK